MARYAGPESRFHTAQTDKLLKSGNASLPKDEGELVRTGDGRGNTALQPFDEVWQMFFMFMPLEEHYDSGFGATADAFKLAADALDAQTTDNPTAFWNHLPLNFLIPLCAT